MTRLLAVSPGARATGLATYDVDNRGIALRAFAVVRHRESRDEDRRRTLAKALARAIADERPRLAIVEDLARKRRTSGVLASLAVVAETAGNAGIPMRALPLRDAAGTVCGISGGIELGPGREAVAWMFPRIRCLLPPGRRAERQGHWAPAWRAAVLGVAAALADGSAVSGPPFRAP